MYRKEWCGFECAWKILDPQGDFVCHVNGGSAAEALLSHLNRG